MSSRETERAEEVRRKCFGDDATLVVLLCCVVLFFRGSDRRSRGGCPLVLLCVFSSFSAERKGVHFVSWNGCALVEGKNSPFADVNHMRLPGWKIADLSLFIICAYPRVKSAALFVNHFRLPIGKLFTLSL